MKHKKLVVVLATFLFLFSLPHAVADEEIEIEIKGGFGYSSMIYNPGIDNLTANMTTKLLLRNIKVLNATWGCMPYAWSGVSIKVLGFSLISVTVNAGDETLTRRGAVIGIFVMFFT